MLFLINNTDEFFGYVITTNIYYLILLNFFILSFNIFFLTFCAIASLLMNILGYVLQFFDPYWYDTTLASLRPKQTILPQQPLALLQTTHGGAVVEPIFYDPLPKLREEVDEWYTLNDFSHYNITLKDSFLSIFEYMSFFYNRLPNIVVYIIGPFYFLKLDLINFFSIFEIYQNWGNNALINLIDLLRHTLNFNRLAYILNVITFECKSYSVNSDNFYLYFESDFSRSLYWIAKELNKYAYLFIPSATFLNNVNKDNFAEIQHLLSEPYFLKSLMDFKNVFAGFIEQIDNFFLKNEFDENKSLVNLDLFLNNNPHKLRNYSADICVQLLTEFLTTSNINFIINNNLAAAELIRAEELNKFRLETLQKFDSDIIIELNNEGSFDEHTLNLFNQLDLEILRIIHLEFLKDVDYSFFTVISSEYFEEFCVELIPENTAHRFRGFWSCEIIEFLFKNNKAENLIWEESLYDLKNLLTVYREFFTYSLLNNLAGCKNHFYTSLLGVLEEKFKEDTAKTIFCDLVRLFGLHFLDFVESYFSHKVNVSAQKSIVEYFLFSVDQKKNDAVIYNFDTLFCFIDYCSTCRSRCNALLEQYVVAVLNYTLTFSFISNAFANLLILVYLCLYIFFEIFCVFLLNLYDIAGSGLELIKNLTNFMNSLWDNFFFLFNNKPVVFDIYEKNYTLREYIDFYFSEIYTDNKDKDGNNN